MLDQKFQTADVLLVIATYNEAENLPKLFGELTVGLPDLQILIIDDASPDGTGRWCDLARDTHPQLSVIHRPAKLGLGSAALTGFAYGISRNFEFIATMDADFSHDPASLVTMIQELKKPENSEIGLVVGSRYVAGGRIIGWPLSRRIVSRILNTYARVMLRLPTKDNSGAFRVYRSDALRKIEIANVSSSGYGYLEEISWRLNRAGVQILEIPITFRDRQLGKSKASVTIGLTVFWQITKMGLGFWK